MVYMPLQILVYYLFVGRGEKWLFSARNASMIAQCSYNVLCTSQSTAMPFLGFHRRVQAINMTSQL